MGAFYTYIRIRQPSKPNALTILNDRPTRTRQIHVHIPTFMHPELSTRHHDHAIFHPGDVCGTTDDAADEERAFDVLDG